jgi:hypothetical protein
MNEGEAQWLTAAAWPPPRKQLRATDKKRREGTLVGGEQAYCCRSSIVTNYIPIFFSFFLSIPNVNSRNSKNKS